MCGRFVQATDMDALQVRFDFDMAGSGLPVDEAWRPRYNVAPGQRVLTVRMDRNGRRVGELMRWGLIPSWARDPGVGYKMINARSETLAQRPAFRSALRRRRCLVPADGFYEWRRQAGRVVPMLIGLKDGGPFALAGLWEEWRSPEGETVRSCAIVTTTPNELMAVIHDRMPVVLSREGEARWLDSALEDPEALRPLLAPYPAAEMTAHPVSALVNSPKNDGPELLVPALEQGSLLGDI